MVEKMEGGGNHEIDLSGPAECGRESLYFQASIRKVDGFISAMRRSESRGIGVVTAHNSGGFSS